MGDVSYTDRYRDIDFREHPERYVIGRGEQGVLIAEPYKSEILPHWRFATPETAQKSAEKIFGLFQAYKAAGDFVGMDMARKFLQMGFTRARRYANHASGHKYASIENAGTGAQPGTDSDSSGSAAVSRRIKPQDAGSEQSPKAESAGIFKAYYDQARTDPRYLEMKADHLSKSKQ